jgi:hypothetical protein
MSRHAAILWAILSWIVCCPANGADPARYDILSLRLAMSPAQVLARLRGQGIPERAVHILPPDCTINADAACVGTIVAPTRDGTLRIDFTAPAAAPGRPIAYRIAYVITARGPSDIDILRADAIDRYGAPTSPATSTWCARLDLGSGTCPDDQPLLRIEPVPHAAAMLTLSDKSLSQR